MHGRARFLAMFCPICVCWPIRVSDVPYAYGVSHRRMGHNIAPCIRVWASDMSTYMLYSQKRASSVVHFKMASSCSDIYVSQLQGCVFPADVSLYVYRDECMLPRRTCSYDQLPTSHSDICVPGNYVAICFPWISFRSGKLISSRSV